MQDFPKKQKVSINPIYSFILLLFAVAGSKSGWEMRKLFRRGQQIVGTQASEPRRISIKQQNYILINSRKGKDQQRSTQNYINK